jgi:cystathionine gamma-synthase
MTDFETRAIHTAQEPDELTGAVMPPIHFASTHRQDAVGVHRNGYEYSRVANPTRDALQEALASLEGGKYGFSFASGIAAEDTVIRAVLKPGDHVVLANELYGGTYRLFNKVYREWGIEFDLVDLNDETALRTAIRPGQTKLVWIETPSNPKLTVFDISLTSRVAQEYGALTVVDNTFCSPYLQRPLELGADIVVHSTTKYLGGHSDILGGAVVVKDSDLAEKFLYLHYALGAVSSPFDSWLTHRSLKTLAVRMDRHQSNAAAIAEYLEAHPGVAEVYYPGLKSHPQHELASRQMHGFGGMVSLRFAGNENGSDAGTREAIRFVQTTRLFALAESLGGVESLVNHPATMTHSSAVGTPIEVTGDIVRLSVGLEGISDLLADLGQALEA